MSSLTLSGRYTLYKAGTRRVVRWLTTTAEQTTDVRNYDPLGRNTTLYITTCATAIANVGPEIPSDILELLLDVITGRQMCAEWYSAKTVGTQSSDADKVEGDKSHRYFIEVLQNVYDSLKAARKEQRARALTTLDAEYVEHKHSEVEAKDSLSNIFAQLELEEPIDEALGCAPAVSFEQPRVPDTTTGGGIEIDEVAEKYFALWCFLEDLAELRAYTTKTWQEYMRGDVSFLVASTVTDTSFGIMRRSEAAFLETYPEFGDLPHVLRSLNSESAGMLEDPAIVACPKQDEGSRGCTETSDLLSSVGTYVLYHFSLFSEAMRLSDPRIQKQSPDGKKKEKIVPAEKGQGTEAQSEPKAPKSKDVWSRLISQYCSYHRFAYLVLLQIPEIVLIANHKSKASAELYDLDEFTEALVDMQGKVGSSIWKISACQTYVELLDVLGYKREVGLDEMEKSTLSSKAIMDRYTTFMAGRQTQVGAVDRQSWKEDMDSDVKLTRDLHSGLSAMIDESEDPSLTGRWPQTLFRDLPILPGVRTLLYQRQMLAMGVRVINDMWYIVSAAHIYRAAKHYHLLDLEWESMDLLLRLHHKKRAIVMDIGPSNDPMVLLKHFELAVGIPLTKVSGKSKKALTAYDMVRNQKHIPAASEFLNAMNDREVQDERLGFRRGEVIEVVLKAVREKRLGGRATQTGRAGTNRASSGVTGVQLLQTYKELLIADEPELNFDHIGFWMDCVRLIETMKKRVKHMLSRDFRNTTLDISFVAGVLFDAGEHAISSRPMETCVLGEAVSTLREYIVTDGDKFSKAALEQSSGHIPEHLRPFAERKSDAAQATMPSVHSTKEPVVHEETQPANGGQAVSATKAGAKAEASTSTTVGVREAFAARKHRGRRLLRSRK